MAGEAAAHGHLAALTHSAPDGPVRSSALPPRRIELLSANAEADSALAARFGVEVYRSPVGEVLRASLPLSSTRLDLADGGRVPARCLARVLAELLSRGGLAIGLAGLLVRLAGAAAVDVDEVRELLKAARQPERFQPLLELVAIA